MRSGRTRQKTKPIPPLGSLLTVLWQVDDVEMRSGKRQEYWKCQCECGTVIDVYRFRIVAGITKSCGCLRRKIARQRGLATAHIARAAYSEQAKARRERHATAQ